jgi:hypothetical protein
MNVLLGAIIMLVIMWANDWRSEWKEPGIFLLIVAALAIYRYEILREVNKRSN